MIDSYKKKVLAIYERRKEEDSLSPRLIAPTPAGLRDECYDVYEEKGRPKEDLTLRLFFGAIEQGAEYSQRIRNFDIDKFRPLVTFLNKPSINTKEKNIKLLLWLIDFERKTPAIPDQWNEQNPHKIPFVTPAHQDMNQNDPNENLDIDDNVGNGGLEILDPENERKKDSQNKEDDNTDLSKDKGKLSKLFKLTTYKATIFIITFSITGGVYWFWKNSADKTIRQPISTEQCMYWTGLHYEPIACNDKDANKLKIPLNKEQVANQQKITLPDTLTEKSIGKVWYGKIHSKPDFYTDSGTNPVDTTKRLLPLTQYMLRKYVSYDRYQLDVLIWSVSLLALFGVLLGMAYRYRPKNPA